MLDPATLLLIALTFLLAGAVKGVVGMGLPTIGLAVLTATLGLQPAMALMIVPTLVTNFWQALAGEHTRAVWSRLWPFLVVAVITIWFGAQALQRVDADLLSALLGVLIAFYALTSLLGFHVTVARHREVWASPLVGAVNGVLTGMTGAFLVPSVLYFQAIGLQRDQMIQAMGMLFGLSSLALAVALGGQRILTWELGILSSGAVLPALLGVVLGQRLRKRLDEATFKRVFMIALLIIGGYIVVRNLVF